MSSALIQTFPIPSFFDLLTEGLTLLKTFNTHDLKKLVRYRYLFYDFLKADLDNLDHAVFLQVLGLDEEAESHILKIPESPLKMKDFLHLLKDVDEGDLVKLLRNKNLLKDFIKADLDSVNIVMLLTILGLEEQAQEVQKLVDVISHPLHEVLRRILSPETSYEEINRALSQRMLTESDQKISTIVSKVGTTETQLRLLPREQATLCVESVNNIEGYQARIWDTVTSGPRFARVLIRKA